MRTDRPYRRALSHEVALAELLAGAGKQFDPRIVQALIAVVAPGSEPPTAPIEMPDAAGLDVPGRSEPAPSRRVVA